jgi:hypothetical protein
MAPEGRYKSGIRSEPRIPGAELSRTSGTHAVSTAIPETVNRLAVTVVAIAGLGSDRAGGEGESDDSDAEKFHRMTPIEEMIGGSEFVSSIPGAIGPEVQCEYGGEGARR